MSKKPPARLTDAVNHNSNGQGTISTVLTTTTSEDQPVACEGDTMEFGNGQTGLIPPGNACVMVNGRRVALMGDGDAGSTGAITMGAPTVRVDEGNPFVFLGENVSIGKNVEFNCQSKNSSPTSTSQNDKYDYYLVNSEGGKAELAIFGLWNLLEDFAGIDITDYFEEERWVASSGEGGISFGSRQILAGVTIGIAAMDGLSKVSMQAELLNKIKKLHPQVLAKMPETGGVLLEAQYQVMQTMNM